VEEIESELRRVQTLRDSDAKLGTKIQENFEELVA
jgi:hypothetical protein